MVDVMVSSMYYTNWLANWWLCRSSDALNKNVVILSTKPTNVKNMPTETYWEQHKVHTSQNALAKANSYAYIWILFFLLLLLCIVWTKNYIIIKESTPIFYFYFSWYNKKKKKNGMKHGCNNMVILNIQ
jgi:hypothetical protein